MEKKITVKEFVKKYNALTTDELKEQFVRSVIKNRYVPYENKVTICEKIVESSYFVKIKDRNGNEIKRMHVNSPAKHMLYCLNIVKNYTNIDIDFKNNLEEFNMLNENGSLNNILTYVQDRETKEFKKILEMVESDLMKNEYETHAFISKQIERFGDLAGATLSPLLNVLIEQVENLDEKKIDKIVNSIGKLSKK